MARRREYTWRDGSGRKAYLSLIGVGLATSLDFLGRLRYEVATGKDTSIPELVKMNDLVSWLADYVTLIRRRQRRSILPRMLAYHYVNLKSTAEREEADKSPVIRLWLAVLLEAGINLHKHFRDMESTLDQHRVLDLAIHRQGIKRLLEVEYGSDPYDVTISVRDVRVSIPPEDCIPGAWNVAETRWTEGVIARGLKPTANWRVSSWEAQSLLCKR